MRVGERIVLMWLYSFFTFWNRLLKGTKLQAASSTRDRQEICTTNVTNPEISIICATGIESEESLLAGSECQEELNVDDFLSFHAFHVRYKPHSKYS